MPVGAAVTRAPGKKARDLLAVWRAAERHRDTLEPQADGYRQAGIAVVKAWLAYQDEIAPAHPDAVTVVTDDERRYVAVTEDVTDLLGYKPTELLGARIDEVTAPGQAGATRELWDEFIRAGRDAKTFTLLAKDGSLVEVAYEARADFPLPGFHVSRLRRVDGPGPRTATAGSPEQAAHGPDGSIEGLASQWLAAELLAAARPNEALLTARATRLGQAYEEALRGASPEDLLMAWERARWAQASLATGSAEWAEARRVSELLRTEYAAARLDS